MSVNATSTGRGAGIGGGGGHSGGKSGTLDMQGSFLRAKSGFGAGIGGGAGQDRGGDYATLTFHNGTIEAVSGGSSSAIGSGAGDTAIEGRHPTNLVGSDGEGGKITFYGNKPNDKGVIMPLVVTALNLNGSGIGSTHRTNDASNKLVINSGSIVVRAIRQVCPPVNGAGTNVYPVVVPKTTDDGNATDLTAQCRLTAADHNYYATTTNTAHGKEYQYAAQLWLPEGSSGNIELKKSDSDTVVATRGFVNTQATLKPNYKTGENVVSFRPQYFGLTIAPGKDIAARAPEQVQAGTAYALPAEEIAVSAYRVVGWQDASGKTYDLGASYTMPFADTTLVGVWGEQTLGEVLDESGTDDLSAVTGDKDVKVKLTVDKEYLDDVSATNANGDNLSMIEGTDYTATQGSTIITLKASWLSSLDAGDYTLNATYYDPSKNDPSPDVTYEIPFTKVGLAKTGDIPWVYGIGIVALLALVTLVARRKLSLRP